MRWFHRSKNKISRVFNYTFLVFAFLAGFNQTYLKAKIERFEIKFYENRTWIECKLNIIYWNRTSNWNWPWIECKSSVISIEWLHLKSVLKQTSTTYKKVNTKKSIVEFSASFIFASIFRLGQNDCQNKSLTTYVGYGKPL